MANTMPVFDIKFFTSAIEAIALAGRGFVALVVKDATATAKSTKTYSNLSQVKAGDYDAKNFALLESVFKGNPTKVKVIVAGTAGSFADVSDIVLQGSPDVDYLVAPDFVADNTAIISFITDKRTKGAKLKGVLVATGSDLEYIVNVNITGAKDDKGTDLPNQEARVAGILAGLSPTRSATYFVIPEIATIDDIVDPDKAVGQGELILFNDGRKVKIARGVNSFVSATPEKSLAVFSKIKNVETMDMISYSLRAVVEDQYVGKYTNNLTNKSLVITALTLFLREMAKQSFLDPSFDNVAMIDIQKQIEYALLNGYTQQQIDAMNESELKALNTGDNVYLIINCKLLDTMEDFYIDIHL